MAKMSFLPAGWHRIRKQAEDEDRKSGDSTVFCVCGFRPGHATLLRSAPRQTLGRLRQEHASECEKEVEAPGL